MVPNINIGSIYRFEYSDIWKNYPDKEFMVIGITDKEDSSTFSKDAIFTKFFTDYGLGITDYIVRMPEGSTVYICKPLKTKDPIEYDKDPTLIPACIIDSTKTNELIECTHITLTVKGLDRKFKLAYQKGEYIQKIAPQVKDALKHCEFLGELPITVSPSYSEFITFKSDYDSYEEHRVSTFKLIAEADKQDRIRNDERLLAIHDRSNVLEQSILDYDRKKLSLIASENSLLSKITIYNTNLSTMSDIKQSINELFDGLENGTIAVNDANYRKYKTKIATFVNLES